jgi:hypothetical protein
MEQLALCQRWIHGRDAYRPAGEPIETSRYEVAAIERDGVAKAFVMQHHYSGSYPAARYRYGLYTGRRELVGVAVFSVPCQPAVITANLPCPAMEGVELGRFVLLDSVPANGETWFLARCFDLLRKEGLFGVVSFSDPFPRKTAAGADVFAGHVGTIYQAHNARYLGRGVARTLRLLPDGTTFSDRAASKIRKAEQGMRYSAGILETWGADPLPDGASSDKRRAWLDKWRAALTRPVRHPGNHKYVWGLDKRGMRHLPASLPYPKQPDLRSGGTH